MENIAQWFNLQISNLTLYLQVESIEMYGLSVTKLIVGSVFAGLLLALLAVRGPHLWARVAATLVLLPALALSTLIALSDQLSRPKPLPMGWLEKQERLVVIEAVERAPKHIEILIDREGQSRLYVLPWSKKLSQSLKGARGERGWRKGAGDVVLGRKKNFQKSIETEDPPEFYFDPWEAPPSKDDDRRAPPEETPRQKRPGRDA